MISFGKSITTPNDPLQKIELRVLAAKIKNPKPDFINTIKQLRNVRAIDPGQYRKLKTKLPYVVAGIFNPPFRKIVNFANTAYFILDIDHLSDKEMNVDDTFERLKSDPHIIFMFRSPSLDGLKLFFKFDEPCYDAGKFSLFYKLFARKYSSENNLNQVIDSKTSDVSRACFLSYDPDAWFNPDARHIRMENYVDFNNQLEIMETEKMLKEEEKELNTNKNKEKTPLPDDIWSDIRQKLNPNVKIKKEKNYIVPEELNSIIDNVKTKMAGVGIETEQIDNINYGKRFRFGAKGKWAEINVFYGKRGFSVVATTKTGSDSELAEICRHLLCELLL